MILISPSVLAADFSCLKEEIKKSVASKQPKKEYEDDKYKPFCSKRCADIDLGNWFSGKYTFEANRLDENDIKERLLPILSEFEINVEEYGLEMLKAGTDLSSFSSSFFLASFSSSLS